jgi:hypothetical protein
MHALVCYSVPNCAEGAFPMTLSSPLQVCATVCPMMRKAPALASTCHHISLSFVVSFLTLLIVVTQ